MTGGYDPKTNVEMECMQMKGDGGATVAWFSPSRAGIFICRTGARRNNLCYADERSGNSPKTSIPRLQQGAD